MRKKIIYIIIILLPLLMYLIYNIRVSGKTFYPGGNGNRTVWDTDNLKNTAKDFELQADGSFLSVSPDPWFTIEESFTVKTILIEMGHISSVQHAQVFYYSDTQELNEEFSEYFTLDKDVTYLQIPNGRYNRFRLDLTDRSGVQLDIKRVTTYGSRAVSFRYLMLVLGMWSFLSMALYHIMFSEKSKVPHWKHAKGFYCLTVGLSVLYSLMLVAGRQLDKSSDLKVTWKNFSLFLCFVTVIFLLLYFCTSWLDKRQNAVRSRMQNSRKILPVCFITLSIVWLFTYLALFPGVFSTDAPYWYYEFSTENVPVSSQWSPFYCAVFYFLVKWGENFFGTYNGGFAVFSFVQMVFVLYVIWNILSFLNRRFSWTAVIIAAAFFTVVPTHVILALTSAQDPVFAACFAMCVIWLFEMAECPEVYFMSKRNMVKLTIWLILLCMIRNNGLYAVIIMAFFALLFMKKYRTQMLGTVTAVFVFVLLYQGPGYSLFGIQKGTALREMLSFPLQQMAYAYNYGHDRLSQDKIDRMQRYISDEGWRTYEPCIADHVKAQLNTDEVRTHTLDFLDLYIDVFLSAPECYIKGMALQTFILWYPCKEWPDARTWHPYINYLCADTYGTELTPFTVNRSSLFPFYEKILGVLYGNGTDHTGYGGNLSMIFSSIPILGTLSEVGIYFWLLLYLFSYALYRRWREPFVIIGICMGVCLTVFLSPVILYRYCAPVIFTAPLFIAVLFTPWEYKDSSKKLSESCD